MPVEVALWCCSKCGAIYYKDFPRCPNDGAEVVMSSRDPLIGKTINQYVIDRLIGEGGMGRVYAAHHATLAAKRYAIKVLLGDVSATASMRRRFAMEAESSSRLDHPNVVNALDFGEMSSSLPYIVMDFVDGTELTAIIGTKPMDPARVLRLARAVCEGLAYAHAKGVVHRDLKPDNIMIVTAPDGTEVPRITDFGLATILEPGPTERLTATGMAMGTPAYAAPEQLAGKRVDHRADLYGLGMTMFEMLTGGTLPFEGHILESMRARAHQDAPAVAEVAPSVVLPRGLEELIAQLLRREPSARPASAEAVIVAIDHIVLDSAIDERAATVVDDGSRSEQMVRRDTRRTKRWPIVFAAVAVLAGVATWRLATRRTGPAPIAARGSDSAPAGRAIVASADHVPTVAPPEPTPESAPAETIEPSNETSPANPRQTTPRRRAQHVKVHTSEARKSAPVVIPVPPPVLELAVPTPPPAPPPPLPRPPMIAQLAAVTVSGALSRATVERAVERVMPAIRACTPPNPQTISVHFTIDESRRAQHLPSSGCVAAALAGVRTDTAPDVGDAEVDVEIRFVVKS